MNDNLSKKAKFLFILFITYGIILIFRIFYIQNFKKNLKKDNKNFYKEMEIKSTRGNILDCKGNIIATNIYFYNICFDTTLLCEDDFREKIPIFCKELSEILKKNEEFFLEKSEKKISFEESFYFDLIKKGYDQKIKYLKILDKVDFEMKEKLKKLPFFEKTLKVQPGIFEKLERRFYPFKDLLSRTIGYVKEGYGVGIEYSYDKELSGINGRAIFRKIIGNNWKILENSSYKPPINGYDVQSTIDIDLQNLAYSCLLEVLQESNSDYGCIILMEVKTGNIKAIINLSKNEKENSYKEDYNYCIGKHGVREPGSVFKIISMIALLEKTNVKIEDRIDTLPYIYWYGVKLNEVNKSGYGNLSIREVFAKSSNTGITKLIMENFSKNPEIFIDIIKKLKIDEKTGINLYGEGDPFIPDPKNKNWSGISLPWMSIGYGLELSPLQVLNIYNGIANDGKMIKPIIVKRILNGKKVVKEFKTKVIVEKMCSEKTIKEIKSLLCDVVEIGTSTSSKGSFYKIVGKSGTANILEKGKYYNKTYITFVGYFPEKTPKYSFIICMSNPKIWKWHYGGRLAIVIKEIANKIASQELEYI
jgi:cell division protein FtsI (penicillin-binding protein 3)